MSFANADGIFLCVRPAGARSFVMVDFLIIALKFFDNGVKMLDIYYIIGIMKLIYEHIFKCS